MGDPQGHQRGFKSQRAMVFHDLGDDILVSPWLRNPPTVAVIYKTGFQGGTTCQLTELVYNKINYWLYGDEVPMIRWVTL